MTNATTALPMPINGPTPANSGGQRSSTPPWRALPVLLAGAFLPVLDAFIVNVALATMGRSLHAGPAELELTVSGYGVAYACALVAGGRLGDRFGRRTLFLSGMVAFTLCSVACGFAPSAPALIVFRVFQGLAAAMMFPQVLATIQASFAGNDRQRAIGFFGATVGAAGAVGQIVGGTLLSANLFGSSWRPIFLVNLPIGIVALLIGRRTVPQTVASAAARVDVRGATGLATVIALVLLPLTVGRASGWPLWTWICLAAAVPAGIAFVASQYREERLGRLPLLPPSLLGLPLARLALATIALFGTCVGGFLFTLSIILQVGHDYSPLKAGLTMGPCALAFFAIALSARRLTARFGVTVLIVGALVFAAGLAVFGVVASTSGATLSAVAAAAPLIVVGLGWGAVMVPLVGLVLAGLPVERAGLAGGVLSTALQIGLATGASVLGTVVFSIVGSHATTKSWQHATVAAVVVDCGLALATAVFSYRLRVIVRQQA
jgi:MFS family permease